MVPQRPVFPEMICDKIGKYLAENLLQQAHKIQTGGPAGPGGPLGPRNPRGP